MPVGISFTIADKICRQILSLVFFMRIAVFGSGGLVGSHAARFFLAHGHEVVRIGHAGGKYDFSLDASDPSAVGKALFASKPDAVFNAVKCSLSTDESESRKAEAWKSNVLVPQTLAKACFSLGIKLLHMSSAWVYEGKEGETYSEESITCPVNFYSYTKAIAEERVALLCPNSLILRTDSVFGIDNRGANFFSRLEKSQASGQVFLAPGDQLCQPIFADEIARLSAALLEKGRTGVFNCVGPDFISRHELALRFCGVFGFDEKLVAPSVSSGRSIRIPSHLKLDIGKINSVCKVQSLESQMRELRGQLP